MATLTIADLDNGKRDLETVDAVANSPADFTPTRFGGNVLTLAGALRRLGYQAPVPYASGLAVDSALFTVSRDGVTYAPEPELVPFTTGAWDEAQWRVVQGDMNLRADLAKPTGAGMVMAGSQSVAEALDNLNTKFDGVVQVVAPSGDGTAALQAAIDAGEANPNLVVQIIGVCDVQGTVQVPNKETDNPEKRLTITGGSLKKTNAGFMFTKKAGQQLPDGTPLQTGHITFDNVRFLGPRTTAGTFILDGDNIIRTKFVNVYGDGIQIAYAAGYLQSIYVDTASVFRKWSGWLFDCGYLYDVKFYGTAEAGQSFMRTRDTAADPAANSLTVRGCIEGLSGKVFEVGVCFGVVIDGNYQEGNAGGDYDFSIGTGFHKGLTLIGNGFQPLASQLADPNYFPVKLGKGAENSITLIGNSSTGNLFDVAAGNSSAIVDLGNWCGAGKKKFSSTTTRMFGFADNGAEMRFKYLDGYGVGLHSYYSKVGFENTRGTVGGESVTSGITYGDANPQTSPGLYPQKNWQKGSLVWASAPSIAPRQYGVGVTRDALIMGWVCIASGTPGTWVEISSMRPY